MESHGQVGKIINVLYIMGTARSGSTILEILLSNRHRVFGAGELTKIIDDGFLKNEKCSCSKRFNSCEIWSRVAKQLSYDRRVLESWKNTQGKMDWHGGMVRRIMGLNKTSDREEYQRKNYELLMALREIADAEVIIDSSKYAARAIALDKIEGVNLSVICLTRSPQGIMHSFQKKDLAQRSHGSLSALLYYLITMASVRIASWTLTEKPYFLKYEDLIREPIACMRDLGRWQNRNYESVIKALKASSPFHVGHIVTGNRIISQERVRFGRQSDDIIVVGIIAKVAVWLMTLWQRMLGF